MNMAAILDSPVIYAADLLIAILVNLKRLSNARQLFLELGYNDFQNLFYLITRDPRFQYLEKSCFVFSDAGSEPYCPVLQESIEYLQLAGILNWPNLQEPGIMRLNRSAEDWYEKFLVEPNTKRLPLQDVISCRQIAKALKDKWPQLIVDRPYLENC